MKKTLQEKERKIIFSEKPEVDKWFKVNPIEINQKLFESKREDFNQERTRQLILEAFEELKKDSKYCRPFRTMIPKKDWDFKCSKEVEEMASLYGDHNANWVEQALEWAQRIANGEKWESICNEGENILYTRLIVWKEEYALVGGVVIIFEPLGMRHPSTYYCTYKYPANEIIYNTVPLVVDYDE